MKTHSQVETHGRRSSSPVSHSRRRGSAPESFTAESRPAAESHQIFEDALIWKPETKTNHMKGELEGDKLCEEQKETSKTINSVFRLKKKTEYDVTAHIGNGYAREAKMCPCDVT